MKTLYKSLPKDLKPNGHQYKIGEWYKIQGELVMCNNGFHASENIIDAMYYVNCEVLAKVKVKGASQKESDKQVWSEIKIEKAWKWEKRHSVELAVFAAELFLDKYEKEYPNDTRPRKAIEAAKEVLIEDNKNNRDKAARAERAIWAAKATWAAEAARAAKATWAAEAARAAAWAAGYEKTLKKCHNKVLKMIKEGKLEELTYTVTVYCKNCGWGERTPSGKGLLRTVSISKGVTFKDAKSHGPCPECGCKTLEKLSDRSFEIGGLDRRITKEMLYKAAQGANEMQRETMRKAEEKRKAEKDEDE